MNYKQSKLALALAAFFLALVWSCSGGSSTEPPPTDPAPVSASKSESAEKTVKETITLARAGDTQGALKNVGVEEISQYLLGDAYNEISADQRDEFVGLMRQFVAKRGLPQALKLLKNKDADSIAFEPARAVGDRVHLPSNLPGTSLKVTWILKQKGRGYVITDFLDHRGRSSMQRSRDKQIQPGYKRLGMDGLLERLKKAVGD